MLEGDRSAVLVKSGRYPIVIIGAINVVLGIFLAYSGAGALVRCTRATIWSRQRLQIPPCW